MTSPWWTDDDQLLAMLVDAVHAPRAVPADFVQAAKDIYGWQDIDAELATLIYDSAHDAALTRTDEATLRALTFATAELTIELEVIADSLIGQLVPARHESVQVRTRDGECTCIAVDELGYFSIRPAPRGAFRLRCRISANVDVQTGWITL
jgi:hypothetical protein